MLILAYHRVNREIRDGLSVSPAMFRSQMGYLLAKGWTNVVLEEALSAQGLDREDRAFAITFDDGYQDNYFHAAPILDELGLRATVYLISDFIDSTTPFPWLTLRGERVLDHEDLHMTSDQLEETLKSGRFVFGSHTRTHPMLSGLSLDAATEEIVGSKALLEERLGVVVQTFCYPAGNFNQETVEITRHAGYKAAVVTPNRFVEATPYTLHRVGVYSNMTSRLFAIKTHPGFALLQKSKAFWAIRGRLDPRHRGRRPTPAPPTI